MEKQKRSYSREFKIKVVELGNHRGNLQPVAMELDVSAKNISRCKQEHDAGKLDENPMSAAAKNIEALENMGQGKKLLCLISSRSTFL